MKPAHEGSTLGLAKVTDTGELTAAYANAARYDALVLAEEFVEGEELTAAFLGNEALPLIRIEAPQGNYDYHNKYFSDDTRYFCPSGLPAREERAIQEMVMRSADALGGLTDHLDGRLELGRQRDQRVLQCVGIGLERIARTGEVGALVASRFQLALAFGNLGGELGGGEHDQLYVQRGGPAHERDGAAGAHGDGDV